MVHRLGKMQQGGPKERPRVTIMQFSVRSYRDAIWKAAKNSSYLKESGLRFMEDFSAGERERRKKKVVARGSKSTCGWEDGLFCRRQSLHSRTGRNYPAYIKCLQTFSILTLTFNVHFSNIDMELLHTI